MLINGRRKKGGTLMAKALAYTALVALILTLGSTLVTIWHQLQPKEDLLRLTGLLLSWQVIAGGLAYGFREEIGKLLNRIAKSNKKG